MSTHAVMVIRTTREARVINVEAADASEAVSKAAVSVGHWRAAPESAETVWATLPIVETATPKVEYKVGSTLARWPT